VGHDLPGQLGHVSREWDAGVNVETLEEILNPLEGDDRCILACDVILAI
jgi:hypothetical protein